MREGMNAPTAGDKTMESIKEHLRDPDVLIRLNAFILSYFGWIGFGILYGFIGRWSVDVTSEFLRLPMTSKDFVVGLVSFTRSLPPLYALFKGVYYIGFAGSIALIVGYLLVYHRDIRTADELLVRYLMAYWIAGLIYMTFHIYAPHVVYNLPGYSSKNTLLTRQEFVFPSLHNTFAAVNVITLWEYRKKLGGKLFIAVNLLIPFSTVFLGHHWVYDVLSGIILGAFVSVYSRRWAPRVSKCLYEMEITSLREITALNAFLAAVLFLIAINPQRFVAAISGLLGIP